MILFMIYDMRFTRRLNNALAGHHLESAGTVTHPGLFAAHKL
jgi:hypothetical protein